MNEIIKKLSELIEHSSYLSSLFTSNAIAMENGEMQDAQKFTKEATAFLSVMLKDIFVDIEDVLGANSQDESDYDFSILDMIKLLSEINHNSGILIGMILENQPETIQKNVKNKIICAINAVKSLAQALFFN